VDSEGFQMNVKIYTTPTCGYCHQAKQYLKDRGVPFTEYDISHDRQAANDMVQLTGQTGVPLIMVNDQPIVGFNRTLLDQLLSATGNNRHISFGLSIADASKVASETILTPVSGALVGKVVPSSPGARAGLQPGDIVTELNMRPIHNASNMEKAVSELISGSLITITFLRGSASRQSEIIV
jgi:glutaredoxin 3